MAIGGGKDFPKSDSDKEAWLASLQTETGVPVVSIIKLSDIIEYLKQTGEQKQLEAISQYRDDYGISE